MERLAQLVLVLVFQAQLGGDRIVRLVQPQRRQIWEYGTISALVSLFQLRAFSKTDLRAHGYDT